MLENPFGPEDAILLLLPAGVAEKDFSLSKDFLFFLSEKSVNGSFLNFDIAIPYIYLFVNVFIIIFNLKKAKIMLLL